MLDLTQVDDAHIDQRLRSAEICWFGSVRPDGRPHQVPVWFFWENPSILIFSMPDAQKVRNLRAHAAVSLALETLNEGEDVVIVEGTAELLPLNSVTPAMLPAFVKKYQASLDSMGSTAEKLAEQYTQPIRITPTKIRHF